MVSAVVAPEPEPDGWLPDDDWAPYTNIGGGGGESKASDRGKRRATNDLRVSVVWVVILGGRARVGHLSNFLVT